MKKKLSELEESILILYFIKGEIIDAKDVINDTKYSENDNLRKIVLHFIYLKLYCFNEELKHFKSLGKSSAKVLELNNILQPATKYLSKRESAIGKIRHQIIAHNLRTTDTKSLANFHEIALLENFPSQFTELALIIDIVSLIYNAIETNFKKEFYSAHLKWQADTHRLSVAHKYFNQQEIPLTAIQEIYADIDAKVNSNFLRSQRNEPLLK